MVDSYNNLNGERDEKFEKVGKERSKKIEECEIFHAKSKHFLQALVSGEEKSIFEFLLAENRGI